jgi:hypothetical protein
MRLKPRIDWRALLVCAVLTASVAAAETIWRLDNTTRLAGHALTVEGAPRVAEIDGAKALIFDGARDGLFVPAIPIAGAKQFTIEVLLRPAEGGPPEQRFFHAQDAIGRRALLETRLDSKGRWWLDTFLRGEGNDRGLALIDPKKTHPTDRWHWVALRYDGATMTHFVNGVKELEGPIAYAPLGEGTISIGVRQNKVYWFKGAIREVRFHTEAIAPEKLQRVP